MPPLNSRYRTAWPLACNSSRRRLLVTPPLLRGRVGAAGCVFGFGAVVLVSLLGALLGQGLGLPATMVIGACGGVPAFLWLLWSPLRTLQDLPV